MMSQEHYSYLSPAEVAAALGVGVSTVKRWVDSNILPAHRTAGGHRKLLLADVLRLVRENEFPHLDLAKLSLQPSPANPHHLRDEMASALENGDEPRFRSLLLRAYDSGVSLAKLVDEAIAPAMHVVGHGWEAGRLDVYEEHLGTQICVAALEALRTRVEAGIDRNDRPLAIGAAPEGDPYLVAGMVVQLTMAEAGWRSVFLGPNMPLGSLALAAETERPRLVFLSASHLEDREKFRREYTELHRRCRAVNAGIVLGGQAIDEELRAELPWSFCGHSMSQLVDFIRTLHPLPTRPRRGRPVKTSNTD
ncbi:MAG: B12-binding domain-containing protein [Gemmataceae bacterium]